MPTPFKILPKELWLMIFDNLSRLNHKTLRFVCKDFKEALCAPPIVVALVASVEYPSPVISNLRKDSRLSKQLNVRLLTLISDILLAGDTLDASLIDLETLNAIFHISHIALVRRIIGQNKDMRADRVKILLHEVAMIAGDTDKDLIQELFLTWSHKNDILRTPDGIPMSILHWSLCCRCLIIAEQLFKERSFESNPVQALDFILLMASIETEDDPNKIVILQRLLELCKKRVTNEKRQKIISDLKQFKEDRADGSASLEQSKRGFELIYDSYLQRIFDDNMSFEILENGLGFGIDGNGNIKIEEENAEKKSGYY
jgi:hypothetical protein